MSERNTCCAVSPLRPVSGLLRPHRRLPRMASMISSCSSRKSAIAASDGFQNYSLPQQLPVGEAELRIGGSRHGSTLRSFRRHLPLALQSLYVPRCGLVQQFLKGAPVVQTAPNFRNQFFWNVNRKPAPLATAVQNVTRVLFTRSASLAILSYARAPTQAQRAQNGRPSARGPIRQPTCYIRS